MCIPTTSKRFPEDAAYAAKQGMSLEEVERERRKNANITSDGSLIGDYVR